MGINRDSGPWVALWWELIYMEWLGTTLTSVRVTVCQFLLWWIQWKTVTDDPDSKLVLANHNLREKCYVNRVYCLSDFARCSVTNYSLLVYQTHRLYKAIEQQEGPVPSIERIDSEAFSFEKETGTYIGIQVVCKIGGPRTRTFEVSPSQCGVKSENKRGVVVLPSYEDTSTRYTRPQL